MEPPSVPTKKRRLKHAISALALLSGLAALPAYVQTSSGETNLPPVAPSSWDILVDADQDGVTDVDELLLGMDPFNPEDGLSDLDGDGIDLAWECAIGTNPDMADTDMDMWSDSEEYLLYGTDPLDPLSFPLSDAPDSGGGTALESTTPVAEAVLAEATPPPSLSNGDFSSVGITTWKSMLTSKEYQGNGFEWNAGAVDNWTAYVGTTIEVWNAINGEKFVELDGSPGNYGIKQAITNPKAGGYVLAWRESGRNSSKAGADPYSVRVYYKNGSSEVPLAQSGEISGFSKMQWTDNALAFQITADDIKNAGTNPIYVAFIPSTSSLNTYGTLIDKVSLGTMELKACKRGSIEKPGNPISGKEVVTIENGDLDQFDHETTTRALTPADVTNGNLQDARKNRDGQKLTTNAIQFDNDFVKFYCDGAFIPKGSKWTIELELVLPKTKAIAANQIFFYTKDGEHVDLSQLKLINAEIPPSGALHDLFDKDRGIFAEIGDLGRASSNSSQTERDYAKECTVRLKIGGNADADGIKLKRGGFWLYDRTSDNGLTFRDGYVDFKDSGAVNNSEDGDVLCGPYAVKSGQQNCHDDTIENNGPTPAGWWMLTERTGWTNSAAPFVWNKDAGRWNRRGNCQQDRSTFPYHLDDKTATITTDRSPKIYQGGYSLWDVTGHFDAGHKIYDPETDGTKTPTPIQFKFDLNKMLNGQTKRTYIQIHADGHNDGTLGCIGLQNYHNAIRVNYLLNHLRATPINVIGTPSNAWNTTTN